MQVRYQLPAFTPDEAIQLARTHYGLEAVAQRLPSERDQNFRLSLADGQQFVLKIANAAEVQAHLDLQNELMVHLARHAPTLAIPRVCPTLAGATLTPISDAHGQRHFLRLLTYVPGVVWADTRPHTPELLYSLGQVLGTLDSALQSFQHPAAHRALKWDVARAGWIRDYLPYLTDGPRRAWVEQCLSDYERSTRPALAHLRTSVIYNDANDHNLLVNAGRVVGVIDFGDTVETQTVCELAIALAYALMNQPDPISAAQPVIAGYQAAHPLTEPEAAVLFSLVCMRLCLSVTNAAYQQIHEPDDAYQQISVDPAWALLEKLVALPPDFAHFAFRQACGWSAHPNGPALTRWLSDWQATFAPIVDADVKTDSVVVDLSVGSLEFGTLAEINNLATFTRQVFERLQTTNAKVAIGRYDEPRLIYTHDIFKLTGNDGPERRTVHLGLDLFMAAGSPVFAPLEGVVQCFADNAAPQDYGPVIILQHRVEAGLTFYTLYGHLSRESLAGLHVGRVIKPGDRLGAIGAESVNGGWPPHLHFQIITDLLGLNNNFPGVATPGQRALWLSLCPDPNLIIGIPAGHFPARTLETTEILAARREQLGPNLSLAYRQPLHLVRGFMQYLYDVEGRRYLDAVNNVPHVGHSHPQVVRAGQEQMAVLNTNSRYLHPTIVRYAQRLCATLPPPLKVCFFVNSGSEANELALRLARTHTRSQETIVLDQAYHGNTNALIEISPYKYDSPGGSGPRPFVHKIPMPDDYRGPYRRADPLAGPKYARAVQAAIDAIHQRGERLGAFVAESLMGSSGQIVFPPGFLNEAYAFVRAAGGVCIADEVQVGFGRVGTHFWGFETQGVVPDIVVLGKPMGNGHPLGAVITTPAIAASFNNGLEYFSTFGGNPVSCAIGLAVLEVLEAEQLQAKALRVGQRLMRGVRELAQTQPIIGDVRGLGLFNGIELVQDRETLLPAPQQTTYIVNRLKERGVLVSIDGPHHNVLKIKPPLAFAESDADFFVETLGLILSEDAARVGPG